MNLESHQRIRSLERKEKDLKKLEEVQNIVI